MAEKVITVKPKRKHKKVMKTRPVTFVCKIHPGGPLTVTEDRYPGPTPKVCVKCHESGHYADVRRAAALKRYYDRIARTRI